MNGGRTLDRVLPRYAFRHAHAVWIHAGDPARVLAIVRDAPLGDSWWIRTLFRLRGLPRPEAGGGAFVRAMGWSVLSGEASLEHVVGYHVPPARARMDGDPGWFHALAADRKVAFAFEASLVAPDIVELRTETRVLCGDRGQAMRFGWYWVVIRPFSALVRRQILRLVRQAAEAEWQATPRAQRDAAVEVVAQLPPWPLALLRVLFRVLGPRCPALAVAVLGRLMVHVPHRPPREEDAGFLAAGRPRQLAFGRETLAGYAFGDGPTVLLVHGLLGSAADFRRIIPAIVASGFTALAIDWKHHGRSPRGPVLDRDSIAHLAQSLAGIPDLHAVVGHSAGAYFTLLALPLLPPDRRPRAVLLAAPTCIAVPIRATMRYLAVPRSLYCRACAWFARRLNLPLQGPDAWGPAGPGAAAPRLLFLHDPADPYSPYADVERLVAADARASLVPRPGAGHFKLLQDAGAIEAACDFLKQPAPSAARSAECAGS